MRCQICDAKLDEFESTKKDPETGEFLDTCQMCLGIVYATSSELDKEDTYYYDIDKLLEDSFDIQDFIVDKTD